MTSSAEDLRAAADLYMSPDVVAAWSTLFRPALRLSTTADPDGVVAQLGGNPALPDGMEWPVWQNHGPLSFLAAVDCARLPHESLDLPFPKDGTLLFFYFDGQFDDGAAFVSWREAGTLDGARVVYVPSGVPLVERTTPEGLAASPRAGLSCEPIVTAPLGEHPALYRTFLDDGTSLGEWSEDEELFDDVYSELDVESAEIQIGGFATPIQGAVENEAAYAALGGQVTWDGPEMRDEAEQWVLLAEFATTESSGMKWRHADQLYWLIRREDLAARRFDAAFFTSDA